NFKNSLINQKYINDSFLIFSRKNYWILLMPVTNIDLEEFLKSLVNLLDDFYQHSNYFIGVSESHPYWRLSLGYKEAEQSINILVSNYPSKRYLLYSKLGILKMFIDDQGKINQLYRDKMLETYIFPLKETDNKNRTELLSTLETFFYCGFSYSRTSEKLFIHKNTLRARIKRIEQILDVDIKHPDNLMNIYISFQIYHLVTE
ncbi:helix-turn-helix domain-containing protein, partial [Enterococcus mundtii]